MGSRTGCVAVPDFLTVEHQGVHACTGVPVSRGCYLEAVGGIRKGYKARIVAVVVSAKTTRHTAEVCVYLVSYELNISIVQ